LLFGGVRHLFSFGWYFDENLFYNLLNINKFMCYAALSSAALCNNWL
jgi:hypothetical protein